VSLRFMVCCVLRGVVLVRLGCVCDGTWTGVGWGDVRACELQLHWVNEAVLSPLSL